MKNSTREQTPRAAAILGGLGLAPFVFTSFGALLSEGAVVTAMRDALSLYGALILAFMGGCRWGFRAAGLGHAEPGLTRAERDEAARRNEETDWLVYGFSVIPALWAFMMTFAAPFIGFETALLGLAVGFVGLYLWDRWSSGSGGAPVWWATLRAPLTIGAIASLSAPALAALFL